MLQDNDKRKQKLDLILGIANGTRQADEAFYLQAEISKVGFNRLNEDEKKEFKLLWQKLKKSGLETLTNDEKLFLVRCYQKAGDDE